MTDWLQKCVGGGDEEPEREWSREYIIFELKCSARDGPKKIDEFLERALTWYKGELMKMKDDRRIRQEIVLATRESYGIKYPGGSRPSAG